MKLNTVESVFQVIELIGDLNGAGVTEISKELDIPTSTAHDYLSTLEQLGYLKKINSEYHLSLEFFRLGTNAWNSATITTVGREEVDDLARRSGETAYLVGEEFGRAIYLYRSIGENSVRERNHTGKKEYLHCIASGKAILANFPPEKVQKVIERHGLPQRTEFTITEKKTLLSELEKVRERGYSLSNEESTIGTAGIGAPIVVDGTVYGAIAVSGPKKRIWREETKSELVEQALETSNEIEVRIMYQ